MCYYKLIKYNKGKSIIYWWKNPASITSSKSIQDLLGRNHLTSRLAIAFEPLKAPRIFNTFWMRVRERKYRWQHGILRKSSLKQLWIRGTSWTIGHPYRIGLRHRAQFRRTTVKTFVRIALQDFATVSMQPIMKKLWFSLRKSLPW